MNIDFDARKVFQDRLALSLGLDKYEIIVKELKNTDISKDADYQRNFNGFYIVRRNEAWRNVYYTYFEKVKNETPTFKEIITYLYDSTGNIEPSFSSKMLSSIFPEMPIWDRYVVQNLNMQLLGTTKTERLENAISLYNDIVNWYKDFLQTDKARECIQVFDQTLPDYQWLSDIKKIDCILWSIR